MAATQIGLNIARRILAPYSGHRHLSGAYQSEWKRSSHEQ
ncbi:hypothetical protein DENIT_110149 [Pseudomonas veronii]|nr:hypothetical protein DENIT_110149 [Pseudomonas veronii]